MNNTLCLKNDSTLKPYSLKLYGGLSSWLLQRLNCVYVFISMCTASIAAQMPVDCSELHQQPVNAVLRPIFVQKLCYKLSSIVTFTFIQIFDQNLVSYWTASKLPRLLDTASKFALFSVSGLKDERLIKKQTYTKTDTWNLYSRVFWIFLPNLIKIDRYNFELYCFIVGSFFWDSVYMMPTQQESLTALLAVY